VDRHANDHNLRRWSKELFRYKRLINKEKQAGRRNQGKGGVCYIGLGEGQNRIRSAVEGLNINAEKIFRGGQLNLNWNGSIHAELKTNMISMFN